MTRTAPRVPPGHTADGFTGAGFPATGEPAGGGLDDKNQEGEQDLDHQIKDRHHARARGSVTFGLWTVEGEP